MSNTIPIILGVISAFPFGVLAGYVLRQAVATQRKNTIEARLKKMLEDAKSEAKEILIDSKSKAVRILEDAKNEERSRLVEIRKTEDRLIHREETLDKKIMGFDEKQQDLLDKVEKVKAIKQEVDSMKEKMLLELQRVANLSEAQAKEELFKKIEKEHGDDLVKRMKKLEETGTEGLEHKAKEILATVIQRIASSSVSEVSTTTVNIPSDDLKGKIIWREGRN